MVSISAWSPRSKKMLERLRKRSAGSWPDAVAAKVLVEIAFRQRVESLDPSALAHVQPIGEVAVVGKLVLYIWAVYYVQTPKVRSLFQSQDSPAP